MQSSKSIVYEMPQMNNTQIFKCHHLNPRKEGGEMSYWIPASSKQRSDTLAGSKKVGMMNTSGFIDGHFHFQNNFTRLTKNIIGG